MGTVLVLGRWVSLPLRVGPQVGVNDTPQPHYLRALVASHHGGRLPAEEQERRGVSRAGGRRRVRANHAEYHAE